MNAEGWLLAGLVLTGGLAAVFIPLMRGGRKKKKGDGDRDGALVTPFMIDGDGRGDRSDSDGGGGGGSDGGGGGGD